MQTPHRSATAGFYTPGNYGAHENVGYLTKRVLASIVQQAEARLEPHGVTHAQWHPLFKLRGGKTLALVELARELHMNSGAMTRLLDRVEKKGLCRRMRSTEDRRVVMVRLTPAGEAAAAQVPTVLSDVLNAHLADFSQTEWLALAAYLRRMLANGAAIADAGLSSSQ